MAKSYWIKPQVAIGVRIYEPRHMESLVAPWWYRTTTKGTGTFVVV